MKTAPLMYGVIHANIWSTVSWLPGTGKREFME